MKFNDITVIIMMLAVLFVPINFFAACNRAAGGENSSDSENASTKSAAANDGNLQSLSPGIKQLWRSHISPPEDESCDSGDSFTGTLKALKSVRMKTIKPRVGEPSDEKTQPATQPARTQTVEISDEVIAELKKASMQGEVDTVLLADALRMAGHEEQAADLYLQAIQSSDDEGRNAYLLFISADCLCQSDSDAAIECYEELITQYGETVWAELAQVQMKILQWKATNKVASLLKSVSQESMGNTRKPEGIANR